MIAANISAEQLGDLLNGTIARSDDAYPFLIRNFTPVVVKGLSFANGEQFTVRF